jgi:predicted dehydrogenase
LTPCDNHGSVASPPPSFNSAPPYPEGQAVASAKPGGARHGPTTTEVTFMSEARQAKLAFLGCGAFTTSALSPTLAFIPEIDLVAVCDIDRAKAERHARNFGARRVYADLHEMLDSEQLDGVFAIGPAPQQYELAPHVLKRGIPVYVEKPSANTSAQARELAELAEAHATWGQCGFMKHFADIYLMAKDIISREEFGPLHKVSARFAQGPYGKIWGMDSAPVSMLTGQLCHMFDLIRFFGGDVVRLQALYHEAAENQYAFLVNVEYRSGAIGQLDFNSLEHRAGTRDVNEVLHLSGLETYVECRDMLYLEWQSREDFTTAVPRAGRYVHEWRPTWTGIGDARATWGYRGEVEHFARRCLGLVEGGPDLWDSYEALRLSEAVWASIQTGGVVTIPPR